MRGAPRSSRRRLVALLLSWMLLAAGCSVEVRLGVRVAENGSGDVNIRFALDADAVEALGGDVESQLRVTDLLQAGWEVTTEAASDGGAAVVAHKAFSSPEELGPIVAEVSGEVGPFRDFSLVRRRSQFRTDFEFRGSVDLEAGVGAGVLDPDDEGVAAPLADEGVGVEELAAFLTERLDDAFSFEVVVDLPGSGAHNAPESVDGAPRWTPKVGEQLTLRADSSRLDVVRIGLLAAAALAAVLALGVWFGLHRRVRRRVGDRERLDPERPDADAGPAPTS